MKPTSTLPQSELRSRVQSKRKALSADSRAAMSHKISMLLEDLLKVKNPAKVATFFPIQNEPDLQLSSSGYTLCYPRVEGDALAFYETKASPADFQKSPLSVPEPPLDRSSRVSLSASDVVLIPGVAFNFKGQRIGMGKGYYDRFLAQSPSQRWGVGYGFQLLTEEWSSQEWDQNVHLLVTENFALEIGSAK